MISPAGHRPPFLMYLPPSLMLKLGDKPPASGQGSKHPVNMERRKQEKQRMVAWVTRSKSHLKIGSHAPVAAAAA